MHFHPTLLPYLSTQLSAERRIVLEEKYWQQYYQLANYLYQADTQKPHMARAIAVREMPNLRRGVELALAAGEVDTAVDFADSIARFLDNFGRWRERETLMARVGAAARSAGPKGVDGSITKAEYLLLSRQGDTLWQQGRAQQAEGLFRELLARLEAGADYEPAYDIAMTQMRVGRCLKAQGRPLQAIEWHQKAITGFERLSHENKSGQRMLGVVFADLGDNLAAIGRFDEAQNAYKSSVNVSRESDNQRQIGVALAQLGTLALQRGDLAAAQKRHSAALDTFRALNEPQMEAVAWHQLGRVAEEAKQWAEAERCYREAVQIRERIRDWPELTKSFNQLAIVAKGDGRFADAERWYLRALEAFEQLKDTGAQAKVFNNLADLYLTQNRLAAAESYARRALAIKETLDLSAEPWTTYSILAQIAAAQGQPAAAAQWRRKEQESYAAYAGSLHEIREWLPLIDGVVQVCQGNSELTQPVEQALAQYEQGWTTTVAAVRQILAGERDIEALRDGLAVKGFVIVQNILQQIANTP